MIFKNKKKIITLKNLYIEENQNLSFYTIRNKDNDINKFINFLGIDHGKKIDLDLLRKFISEINNLYSKKSVLRIVSNLKSFFDFLVDKYYIEKNLLNEINNPKVEKTLPDIATLKDIDKLIDSIDESSTLGVRDKAIIEIIYAAGLRVSEVHCLNIEDIDFELNQAIIFGKGKKYRSAIFADQTKKVLEKYIKKRMF